MVIAAMEMAAACVLNVMAATSRTAATRRRGRSGGD